MESQIRSACRLIRGADALVIAAGAGMGVDSGLPDFRGDTGFWRAYPALRGAGMGFVDLACPATFERDPDLAWGFYGHRLALYRETLPHAGFGILRAWGARMAAGAFVMTSNVDGQFQKAGFARDQIWECHGTIHELQCLRPCRDDTWPSRRFVPDVDVTRCRLLNAAPRCRCGAIARPNILLFDDPGWVSGPSDAQQAALNEWLEDAGRIVVVEIGAGTDVPSVRGFSERLVRRKGAGLVRINPREAGVPHGDHAGIALGALQALQAIDATLGSICE